MTEPLPQTHRVGAFRPNQLLHTYGVGAMADLPNLSVVMLGLDQWELNHSRPVVEERLLAAVRAKLRSPVQALRMPPHLPESTDPFAEWARTGVPVGIFPNWLRCAHTLCNRLGRVDSGIFDLVTNQVVPERTRFVHNCSPGRGAQPTAVPARFVLACSDGHLDDFPWMYFVHRGVEPESGHSLKMVEQGTSGQAADVVITCDECGDPPRARSMSEAFGEHAAVNLPACRGRHPHLGTFETCDKPTRTLVLGATNSWFPLLLRAFTLPRDLDPIKHLVAEFWKQLEVVAQLPEDAAKQILPTQFFWSDLEQYGVDHAWRAIRRHARAVESGEDDDAVDERDLLRPEWAAFTHPGPGISVTDFTSRPEPLPDGTSEWLHSVVLVPRLREVSALYGFTRIDAPEWEVVVGTETRYARLAESNPDWVPCAELRGEGIFLRFNEERILEWEQRERIQHRERELLIRGHEAWRANRRLPPGRWPGLRYVLLHTFAHALMREFALESGYSAAGIGERIYAEDGDKPMAGVLLYTVAPDSEGTLGGLVSLGKRLRLGQLIEQAMEAARLCSSDPLCAEHDPRVHGRLYGAACHACLFAAETSCERGNQYLDRVLLVNTLADTECGFFS